MTRKFLQASRTRGDAMLTILPIGIDSEKSSKEMSTSSNSSKTTGIAIDHLFTIRYEPYSILLNKIFSFIQMFTLLRKHSSPDYFTLSITD